MNREKRGLQDVALQLPAKIEMKPNEKKKTPNQYNDETASSKNGTA